MSKILSLSLVVAFGLVAMTGCGEAEKPKATTPAVDPGTAAMKSMGGKMGPPAGVATGDKMDAAKMDKADGDKMEKAEGDKMDKMEGDKMEGEKMDKMEPAKAEPVGSTTGAGAELPAGDAKKSE